MKMLFRLFVVLVSMTMCAADGELDGDRAHLLATKSILNSEVFVNREMTVEYRLYNVGAGTATNVHLSDVSFVPDDYEMVGGSSSVTFARIAPQTNVSHCIVVKPIHVSIYNVTTATIRYEATENDASNTVVLFSTSPGVIFVHHDAFYRRWFESHTIDWLMFALMTTPSVLIPGLLWYKTHSKYVVTKKRV
jgi:translocon-associated protein subunit beta